MITIIDDEEPIRDAMAWLLKSCGLDSRGFASATDFIDAMPPLTQLAQSTNEASCLILDIRMPGMSGADLFERLRAVNLHEIWPVLFLTGHGDVPMAVAALKNGAFDFIEKPFNDNALVERVRAALAVSTIALDRKVSQITLQSGIAQLTVREHEVMQLIVDGHYNKVIADKLDISMRTVEVYRARIFQKMGVRTAVELAGLLRAP